MPVLSHLPRPEPCRETSSNYTSTHEQQHTSGAEPLDHQVGFRNCKFHDPRNNAPATKELCTCNDTQDATWTIDMLAEQVTGIRVASRSRSRRNSAADSTSGHMGTYDGSTSLYTPISQDSSSPDLNLTPDSTSSREQADAYQTLGLNIRGIGNWACGSSDNLYQECEDVAEPPLELDARVRHIKTYVQKGLDCFETGFSDSSCMGAGALSSGKR